MTRSAREMPATKAAARADTMAPSSVDILRDLALIHLAVAHGTDDYLSDAEMQALVSRLDLALGSSGPAGALSSSVWQAVVEGLEAYADADNADDIVKAAMVRLRDACSREELTRFLNGISDVAKADGIVLPDEQGILSCLERCWDIRQSPPGAASVPPPPDSGALPADALHSLAFIYLVLGHGTDYELSESETRMMLRRLEEWQPMMPREDVRRILQDAMARYARRAGEEVLSEAIHTVKQQLPPAQRMAALNDLIKIANADGVFLDDEEDLINRLLLEWEVDPYASYGEHGTKEGGTA